MNIGIVGLGRMGANMARRLARGGVRVTGFDPDEAVRRSLAAESIAEARSPDHLERARRERRMHRRLHEAGTA
jgi:6-phosphogluconate dehydrogenase